MWLKNIKAFGWKSPLSEHKLMGWPQDNPFFLPLFVRDTKTRGREHFSSTVCVDMDFTGKLPTFSLFHWGGSLPSAQPTVCEGFFVRLNLSISTRTWWRFFSARRAACSATFLSLPLCNLTCIPGGRLLNAVVWTLRRSFHYQRRQTEADSVPKSLQTCSLNCCHMVAVGHSRTETVKRADMTLWTLYEYQSTGCLLSSVSPL